MKSRTITAWLLIATAMFSSAAHAQKPEVDKRTPLERYQGEAYAAVTLCQLQYLTQSLGADLRSSAQEGRSSSDYRQCIREQRQPLKVSYDGLARTLKKPAAREALKEHYIATLAALDGIEPLENEIRIDYQRRQNANTSKAKDKWARFEVEK